MSIPTRLTGNETISSNINPLRDASVLDFWCWAFSDLKANNIRGIFAEWLVAKLLDIDAPVRDSWAAWDLETPEGVRIEVKTGAYLQSWEQKGPSKIVFSGLRGQTWEPLNGYSGTATCNADLYVFCVQTEKDPDKWSALDLSQWRFYIMTRSQIEETGCKSLALSTVRRYSDEMNAAEFVETARRHISGCALR